MVITLAFDVYGTLIDTHGVVSKLRETMGDKAEQFSHAWRDKQLEYSFRRGLMRNYQNFSICTSDALDYMCAYYHVAMTEPQKKELLSLYCELPAFEDVKTGLVHLQSSGFRMYAFSNGSADVVEKLLIAAGIRDYFIDVVSVDDIKTFKPDPDVYRYFLTKACASGKNSWLISSNSFDVIGAISAGMQAVWVQRSEDAVFDPWGITPSLTVKSISELDQRLDGFKN